jgi:uncharacterized protein YwgA
MRAERFRWLAGLIAAHPERKLVGRTRLQKEMWILQRLGMPSGYSFRMHYYGPYSEGIQAELNLLERFGLVKEGREQTCQESGFCSVFVASKEAIFDPISEDYRRQVDQLAREDAIVLELAATYDMYRSRGLPHEKAIGFLKVKKGDKISGGRDTNALALLGELGLPSSP